ncbi:unnamed protein product [Polarella glacialis]|uniref:Uncharacterized protein n=1 Tax=Polarella glacialis TaxID=89957 RepID=A0A813K8P0_POLGL|nr:unnamed protein product [Polarella glacialis]
MPANQVSSRGAGGRSKKGKAAILKSNIRSSKTGSSPAKVRTKDGMGGVKKSMINKSKRRKEQQAKMKVDDDAPGSESRQARRKRIVAAALGSAATETPDQLKDRQAGEWKEMKAKVAVLKKDRKKLPRNGSKDLKVTVSKQIRQFVEDMKVRHVAECKTAGVAAPAAVAEAANMMSDV